MEAHDQQNLERSLQLADLTHKQWTECRRDVDMEAKLLQKVQQAQKSCMDHRLALLESSPLLRLDSSLASQSGLAHQVSSGLQHLSQSIKQDKANQAGWEQAVVQDILGGMAALRFICRDLEQAQQQGLAHLHSLHLSDCQALFLPFNAYEDLLAVTEGHSSSSQSLAEEQQGLLLAAQHKLYTQQSRLIGSVELLRREVESVAVEQTLQSSIADAEMTKQSHAAASGDREALQCLGTLSSLQAAQSAAESRLASAVSNQQSFFAASEAEQTSCFAAVQEHAFSAAADLQNEKLSQQLSSLTTRYGRFPADGWLTAPQTDADTAQMWDSECLMQSKLVMQWYVPIQAGFIQAHGRVMTLGVRQGQKETLRAETSERIASALQEHNSDVADQESVLNQWSFTDPTGWSAGKQIDAAMIAKQDQLAAAISQFENTLRSEVEARLQGSLDSLKVTMTSNADALKAHFDSELLSLRAAVTQLEGRTWQARGKPSSAAQPKAWAAGLDT
ncbi:hypothetical protein WJX77_003833 [Trebouxia sp. C0004]